MSWHHSINLAKYFQLAFNGVVIVLSVMSFWISIRLGQTPAVKDIDRLKSIQLIFNGTVILLGILLFGISFQLGKLQEQRDAENSKALTENVQAANLKADQAAQASAMLKTQATRFTFSEQQKQAFLKVLRTHSKPGQFLVSATPGLDAGPFALEIRELLKQAGERYIMNELATTDGPDPRDGVIVLRYQDRNHPPKNLTPILEAFTAANIPVRPEVQETIFPNTTCIFVPSKPPLDR